MKTYYVYAHQTPDGNIFYIGKGSDDRLNTTGNRSKYWKRISEKYGFKAIILEDNLAEIKAYEAEIKWIAKYKLLGQCRANFTIGGDGVNVEKRWWNEKISKALTGVKRPIGYKSKAYKNDINKEELIKLYFKDKLSSVKIGKIMGISCPTVLSRIREYGLLPRTCGRHRVRIICVTDGREFVSITDAAKKYNLFRENIRKVLHGEYKHTGGKKFRYVSTGRGIG